MGHEFTRDNLIQLVEVALIDPIQTSYWRYVKMRRLWKTLQYTTRKSKISSTEASNPIIIIGDETPTRIFGSFSELVSSYLTDADLLLSNIKESPEG